MPIKQLTLKDYNEIKKIWDETGLPVRPSGRDSYDNLKKQLLTGNVTILADELDEKIRGVVLLSHDERKGWINRLAVLPKYRRQGIASGLLKSAEEYFRNIGIEIFTALIEAENVSSIKCFEQNEFKCWENIYYFSKRGRDDI
ncbi:MAG: GNAT family N-acetyltransferase [Candidatus Hodarchaeales archaeon]|jgi:ribosomal protein S18 acetylase RimI-like enzyme